MQNNPAATKSPRYQAADPTPPDPPLEPNLDLRKYHWMRFDVVALHESDFWSETFDQPEIRGMAFALWTASWRQVPPGSLPNDILIIAKHAGVSLPQSLRKMTLQQVIDKTKNTQEFEPWVNLRINNLELALHGYILCSDNRLYHSYLCSLATTSKTTINAQRQAGKEAMAKRWKDKKKIPVSRYSDLIPTDPNPTPSQPRYIENKNKSSIGAVEQAQSGSQQPPPQQTEPADQKQLPAGGDRSRAGANKLEPGLWPDPPAIPEPAPQNGKFVQEFGLSPNAMRDALHQATSGSSRMAANVEGLENLEPIVTLLRSTPGMTLRDDVLPAITSVSLRAGARITSWRYFRDAIVNWHANRLAGRAQPGAAAAAAPAGHPWKGVVDQWNGKPRLVRGHSDFAWYDAIAAFQADAASWDRKKFGDAPGERDFEGPWDIAEAIGVSPRRLRTNPQNPPGLREKLAGVINGGGPLPTQPPPPENVSRVPFPKLVQPPGDDEDIPC